MEKYIDDDIQRTEDDIFRELLAVATDNEDLLPDSPERYRAKVIRDMTSLVKIAKQDTDIRQFFLQTGRDPEEALDILLHRAVATL